MLVVARQARGDLTSENVYEYYVYITDDHVCTSHLLNS